MSVRNRRRTVSRRPFAAGVDCVWTAQLLLPEQKGKVILGRSYWTAEAAARAVDRAQLAVHGRDKAVLNFPSEWYGPEVLHALSLLPRAFSEVVPCHTVLGDCAL